MLKARVALLNFCAVYNIETTAAITLTDLYK